VAEKDADFSIVYEGPAVDSGTIDARDLAPALLAFADLVDQAHGLVPELPERVGLRVRAGFERGSFEVHLEIAQLYEQLVEMFSGQSASAWANLFQILGLGGALGVFQLVRRSRGRQHSKVTIERTERVQVTFEGDKPILVDRKVLRLFENLRARKALESIVAPLKKDGIDVFKIRRKGKEVVDIPEEEVGFFDAPTKHEGETVNAMDTRLIVVSPSFRTGNKWRVSDGSRTIYVSIEDPQFVRSVQTGEELFGAGDLLVVELETRQWMEGQELKAEHVITKVHGHQRGSEQAKLDWDKE
jgi:hypothetical protein